MSYNGTSGDVSKPTSPIRPKHQVSRSITDVSVGGAFPKIYRAPHHHHPHLHHRNKDDRAVQSAHPNLQPSGLVEGTKSEGVTPNQSRNGSRRTSVLGNAWEADLGGMLGSLREKRVVKEVEVKEERDKGVLRATELRNALMGLNTLSNNTTRRLDTTYYMVLEKLSTLQNTIASMKEVATMTRQLNTDFKTESEAIVRDITTQLEGFEGFEEQQKRIESLQERVKKGRERIKSLGGRVEVVKERVEGWKMAEGEWQEKTRKRLRILWILMSVCVALFLALVVFHYTPARTQGPGVMKGWNASSLAEKIPDVEKLKNETWNLKRSTEDALESLLHKEDDRERLEPDPRLRLFDEL